MSLKSFSTVVLLLSFVCCPSFAQETKPQGNEDVKQIMTNLALISKMTAKCSVEMLPKMDCKAALDHFVRCRDARYHVLLTEHWYKYAVQVKTNALVAGMDELLAERIRAQVDVQQNVVDGATYQTMVADVRAHSNAFLNCFDKIDEMSFQEFQNLLYDLANDARMLQASENLFRKDECISETITEFDGAVFDDEFSTFLTSLEEKHLEVHYANNSCKKWRVMIAEPEFRDFLDEYLGKVLLCYNPESAETRAKQIDAFIADESELSDEQKTSLKEIITMNDRAAVLGKASDAMDELLMVNTKRSSGGLAKCYFKMNEDCGAMNLNVLPGDLGFPEGVDVKKFAVDPEVAADDTSWETPLKFMDEKMAGLAETIKDVPELSFQELVASLDCELTQVKARSKFNVNFTAMYQFMPKTWVAFVPREVPHGLEGVNRRRIRGRKSYLFSKEKGVLEMKAPRTPGLYDLRMNELYSGREVASFPIEVLPADPKEKADPEKKADGKKKEVKKEK